MSIIKTSKNRISSQSLSAFLLLTLFVTPVQAIRVDGVVEVILRPPQPQASASERLEYARRLYDADKFSEAHGVAEGLAIDADHIAPEAMYLLGRIAYSTGDARRALGYFERLALRYPTSAVVSHGSLAQSVSLALGWLIEEHAWPLASGYLKLLRSLDGNAVAQHGSALEQKLSTELFAYQKTLNGMSMIASADMDGWLRQRDQQSCQIIGSCAARDWACEEKVTRQADQAQQRSQTQEGKNWQQAVGDQFLGQKRQLARMALEEAQAYPLLRHLVTDQMLVQAIVPTEANLLSSPFHYRVETVDFEKNLDGLKMFTQGTAKHRSWRVCRRMDESSSGQLALAPLRFAALDRESLLQRLGGLLNANGGEAVSRQRKL